MHLVQQAETTGQEQRVCRDVLRMELRVSILTVDGEDETLEDVEGRVGRPGFARPGVGDGDLVAATRLRFGQRRRRGGVAPGPPPGWHGKKGNPAATGTGQRAGPR